MGLGGNVSWVGGPDLGMSLGLQVHWHISPSQKSFLGRRSGFGNVSWVGGRVRGGAGREVASWIGGSGLGVGLEESLPLGAEACGGRGIGGN